MDDIDVGLLRSFVAVAETGIELILETRDEAHAEQIVQLVRATGYPVTRMR